MHAYTIYNTMVNAPHDIVSEQCLQAFQRHSLQNSYFWMLMSRICEISIAGDCEYEMEVWDWDKELSEEEEQSLDAAVKQLRDDFGYKVSGSAKDMDIKISWDFFPNTEAPHIIKAEQKRKSYNFDDVEEF